jgi:hypothetical protein
VATFGRILSVLSLGFSGGLAKVVPHLVLLVQVGLDLVDVALHLVVVKLGPRAALGEWIIFPGLVVLKALSVQLILGLLRSWHRYSIGRGLG